MEKVLIDPHDAYTISVRRAAVRMWVELELSSINKGNVPSVTDKVLPIGGNLSWLIIPECGEA